MKNNFLNKELFNKLLLITFGLVLSFCFFITCEFAVRFLFPNINYQFMDANIFSENMYGPIFGLKPNISGESFGAVIETDNYGFRKSKHSFDPKKPSWLLLGDSVSLGIGVEADSTFSGLLSEKLKNWNILNMSVPGYTTYEYIKVAQYFINKIPLKRITVCYCLNDIYSNKPGLKDSVPGFYWRNLFGNVLTYLRSNSKFYMLIKDLVTDRSKQYFEYDLQFYDKDNDIFHTAINNLSELSIITKQKDIPFDIIIIPSEYQLRIPENKNLIEPQFLLVENLTKKGIRIYNPIHYLWKHLNDKVDSKDLYLFADGYHLSNVGHRLIYDYFNSEN